MKWSCRFSIFFSWVWIDGRCFMVVFLFENNRFGRHGKSYRDGRPKRVNWSTFFFSFRFSSSCVRKTTRWLSSTSTITARWSSTGGSVLNTHLVANVSRFPTKKKNKQESSDNLMFESIQSILTDKSLVPVTFYSSNLNNFITTSFEMLIKLLYLVGTIPIWLIGRLVKNFVI